MVFFGRSGALASEKQRMPPLPPSQPLRMLAPVDPPTRPAAMTSPRSGGSAKLGTNGDVSGDSAEAEGERYYGQLTAQVKRFYDVSETIPDQERLHLVAQVGLFIDQSGQLARVRLVKSSGNDLFDSSVLAAVKRAAPFAPPPSHLRTALQKYGMMLADHGGAWFVSGAPDPRWSDDNLHELKKVKGRDLEVVRMGKIVTE